MQSFLPFKLDSIICGIDEAGRGCIAGSLFVCGVVLSQNIPLALKVQLKDSKSLSESKRNILAPLIQQFSDFYLVKKTHQEIDDKGLSLFLLKFFIHFFTFNKLIVKMNNKIISLIIILYLLLQKL